MRRHHDRTGNPNKNGFGCPTAPNLHENPGRMRQPNDVHAVHCVHPADSISPIAHSNRPRGLVVHVPNTRPAVAHEMHRYPIFLHSRTVKLQRRAIGVTLILLFVTTEVEYKLLVARHPFGQFSGIFVVHIIPPIAVRHGIK